LKRRENLATSRRGRTGTKKVTMYGRHACRGMQKKGVHTEKGERYKPWQGGQWMKEPDKERGEMCVG